MLRAIRHFIQFFLSHHIDGGFHQIADHGFNIAPHVADFRVFGGFDLHEWAARQARKSPGNFGFAHAGRANHQDILGQHVFSNFRRQLLSAHTIAQRNRNCALGRILPDDIFIELRDDFARGHVVKRRK